LFRAAARKNLFAKMIIIAHAGGKLPAGEALE
jgi:hypothetical protein